LYDGRGQPVAHHPNAATFRIPIHLITLGPGEQGSGATTHLPDGHDVVLTLQAVPGFPLLVAAAADKASAADAWNTQAMHSDLQVEELKTLMSPHCKDPVVDRKVFPNTPSN
jgi:hypothetical protein